jgi:sulfate adenylyltransferase subunit 1
VDWSEARFAEIAEQFTAYARSLGVREVVAVPISALAGDNVVTPSTHTAWYGGPTVLEYLESVPTSDDLTSFPARFPVQCVIRPRTSAHADYRGYAGQVASGVLRIGERVVVLPSGVTTKIAAIDAMGESVPAAWASQSVTVRLADDLDVTRGDLIAPIASPPVTTREIDAMACHVAKRPLLVGARVLLRHTTRTVQAFVRDIGPRLTLDDSAPAAGSAAGSGVLEANDIGRITLRTATPLAVDAYADCRRTGSFLLIDPADGATLTAGMTNGTGDRPW